jgi:hypothetical protein
MPVQTGISAVFLHIPFRVSAIFVNPAAADWTVHSFRIFVLKVNFFIAGRAEVPVQPQRF